MYFRIEKYRMLAMAHGVLGIPKKLTRGMENLTNYTRNIHKSLGQRLSGNVKTVLCRDSSRIITR